MKRYKAGIISLGCSKNLVDSELILGCLRDAGFEITADEKDADVIVVNTCGFIASAKEESINTILEAARDRKDGAKLVVSRASSDVHQKFLLRNGADQVVYPEQQLAKWTAIRFSSNHILDFVNLEGDYDIYEVDLPERWVGMSVGEIDIRKKYGINIIAVRRNGTLDFSVKPETVFEDGNTILVLGQYRELQKCFKI